MTTARLYRTITTSLLALALSLSLVSVGQTAEPTLIRSDTKEWSQWRGPARDGISLETGLLQAWPADGPDRKWEAKGIGRGYSSPIIAEGSIYITGDVEEDLVISAFSLDGKLLWTKKNGKAWEKSFPGARASCTYDEGKLYSMNAHGRLACLNAKTGEELWAVNVLEQCEGENIIWGICEAVIVHGDLVFATPAGKKGLVVALNKNTGKTVWTTPAIADEKPSYASPILVSLGEQTLLINNVTNHAFAVDIETGKLCWKVPKIDPKNRVTTIPVLSGNNLVLTNGSRGFGGVYGVEFDGSSGKKIWRKEISISHGSAVCLDGKAYGATRRGEVKGWVSVDVKTGEAKKLSDLGVGSVIYADGRFYCLTQTGTMTLQQPTAEGFKSVGSFQIADAKDIWAHPVISGGKLYLRVQDALYCYDIGS